MSYREALSQSIISISTSENSDMPVLGLSEGHLRDAMTEIARHLLALGARLAYGGDLREYGFTELLFELVARHRRDADERDERPSITNYLAWPVHMTRNADELEHFGSELTGSAQLVLLTLEGHRLGMADRHAMPSTTPSSAEWAHGLRSMRRMMLKESQARIVLGGRVDGYKGAMPGIAEEALLSLQSKQPLFLVGGFGGCTRDIAQTLGFESLPALSRPSWDGRSEFEAFAASDLNNGLTHGENVILVNTPHVDQAVTIILRGLLRLNDSSSVAAEAV